MSKHDLLSRRDAVVPVGVARYHATATVVSAKGSILVDADGREIIDFTSGIGVLALGHCHPKVVAAVQAQAESLLHTSIHVATYEAYVALSERLAKLFPHGGRSKVVLVNTGAEAVENAIKIARQATGRQAVICFSNAFHGRTMMALSLTSKVAYKVGCGPYAPEVYRVPFPNRFATGAKLDEAAFVAGELDRLREVFRTTVPAGQVAAIIIEPVQGEGGFVAAPGDYLRGLREICDEHGILLIADEVQTGFFRTGKWAAYQHSGVDPDISTWAKALGGGLPIAAVVGKADVMDRAVPGTIGGTYGGNPVCCAAALAALDVYATDEFQGRTAAMAKTIRASFDALARRFPALIGDVRGLGPMLALEFVADGDPGRPRADVVKDVAADCLQRGLLIITAGTSGNVIRALPPLVMSQETLQRGLTILDEAVARRAAAEMVAVRTQS